MADAEDDDVGEPAPKRVHYGSLEEVERQRLLERSGHSAAGSMSAEIKAGIEAGHINLSARKLYTATSVYAAPAMRTWNSALEVREDIYLHVVFSSYNGYPCTLTHPRPPSGLLPVPL